MLPAIVGHEASVPAEQSALVAATLTVLTALHAQLKTPNFWSFLAFEFSSSDSVVLQADRAVCTKLWVTFYTSAPEA